MFRIVIFIAWIWFDLPYFFYIFFLFINKFLHVKANDHHVLF